MMLPSGLSGDPRRTAPTPKAGAVLILFRENAMAGYGLFVLILAVGAATLGYFWLRDD